MIAEMICVGVSRLPFFASMRPRSYDRALFRFNEAAIL